MKESQIQRAILDYLAAKRVLAYRMNTGAIKIDQRFMRFGVPGMADILAFPRHLNTCDPARPIWWMMPLWIECKATTGKQSELQKSFQAQVQEHGHKYLIARCIEDVERAL